MIADAGLTTLIEVDGGVKIENAKTIADAGADILVMVPLFSVQAIILKPWRRSMKSSETDKLFEKAEALRQKSRYTEALTLYKNALKIMSLHGSTAAFWNVSFPLETSTE